MSAGPASLSELLRSYEHVVGEIGEELLAERHIHSNTPLWPTTAFALAANARAHHRALLEGLAGSSPRASQIHARPLVETAILIDYLAEDPEVRVWQWVVHGLDQQLKMLRKWREAVERGDSPHTTREQLAEIIEHKIRERDDALEQGRQAAVRQGADQLGALPNVEAQARRKPALFMLYTEAFRVMSGWVHVAATLFTKDRFEAEMTLLEDSLDHDGRIAVRALSVSVLVSIYAESARALGEDDIAERAEVFQPKIAALEPI